MGWDSYDRQMSVFTSELCFFTLSAESIKLTVLQKRAVYEHKKIYMIIKPEILAKVIGGIKT